MDYYKCSVCGLIYDAEAPEKCPKCGATKDKFAKLDAEEAKLVETSRRTNYLHMKIIKYLVKNYKYAEQGIGENLDPTCVAIFERVMKDSYELQQMIKAELESHVNKKKWG